MLEKRLCCLGTDKLQCGLRHEKTELLECIVSLQTAGVKCSFSNQSYLGLVLVDLAVHQHEAGTPGIAATTLLFCSSLMIVWGPVSLALAAVGPRASTRPGRSAGECLAFKGPNPIFNWAREYSATDAASAACYKL